MNIGFSTNSIHQSILLSCTTHIRLFTVFIYDAKIPYKLYVSYLV